MPTIARGNTAEIYCPLATSVTFTPGSGGAVRVSVSAQSGDPAIAPRFIQSATAVAVTAGSTVFAEAVTADATYTESVATAVASLVSGAGKAASTAVAEAAASLARSAAAFADTIAFTDSWAGLTNWTLFGTPGMQVSGARLYATGSGGGNSGANRGISLSAGQNLRAVTTVILAAPFGFSGGAIVGVCSDAANAVPTAGGAAAFGLYFKSSAPEVQTVENGVFTTISGVTLTAGTYVVTVTVDQTYITVSARKTDGSVNCSTRRLRSGFAVNNLYLFDSDARALTGHSIGPYGSRVVTDASQPFVTVSPRTGIEGVGTTVTATGDGTNDIRVMLPPGFDSRIPTPVVMCFHGSTSDAAAWTTNANMKVAADAFLAAGYIVLAASLPSNLSTFGAASGLAAYRAAYRYVRDKFVIGPLVVYANSMGGIESLNAIALGYIPPPVCWVGSSPTYSLSSCYSWATFNFASLINTAYGVTSYASIPAGYDPALQNKAVFNAMPVMILTASDDVSVDPVANGQQMAADFAGASREVNLVAGITGGHSFSLTSYTAAITAFIAEYLST